MNKYAYFKKGQLDVLLDDDKIISAPSFVNKGAKNYRFNLSTLILEKNVSNVIDIMKYKNIRMVLSLISITRI